MDVTVVQAATPAGAAILVTILIQLVKPTILTAWTPRLAILFGVAVTMLATWALGEFGRVSVVQALINGILAGSASIGIYENIKPHGEVPRG